MTGPFELPDGLAWRELTDSDRTWLGALKRGEDWKHGITITITLRRTSDGAERVITDGWYPFSPTTLEDLIRGITFQWTDGNYGCDCNRRLYWDRAGTEKVIELVGDLVCSSGAYTIISPAWLANPNEETNS